MKSLATIALTFTILLCAQPMSTARGQASTPAGAEGTAGGMLVFDSQRLALAVRDYVFNQLPQMLTAEIASHKAFAHYRRVTQYVGVVVFRSGAVRDALTNRAPNHPATRYEDVYRREYAADVPETEQDSLARARMDRLALGHLTELDSIRHVLRHLHRQLKQLNGELNTVLKRPPAPASDTTSHARGEVQQLQAAIQGKTDHVAALHARAVALQGLWATDQRLYAGQQAARAQATFNRGAADLVGPELTAPLVPQPRYGGLRNFLRFPGLSQGGEGN